MVKCDRYDGVSGRKVLECMTWIGTAVLWTVSGGVPHSLGIMGASAAAEANGLTFLPISDKSLGSVEVHQVWSLSSDQPLVARMAIRTAKQQELALRGTMTNYVHAKHARRSVSV
jgi:glycogen synthase